MSGVSCEWCARPAFHFPVSENGRGFCHVCAECDCHLCGDCSDSLDDWAEWADAVQDIPAGDRIPCDRCGQ